VSNGNAVSITDREGNFVEIIDDPNATPDTINHLSPYITIDKIFDYVNTRSKYIEFRAEYDSTLGYPTFLCLDNCYIREPLVEDGYLSLSITNFEVLP
jgi:hypothetical protein